MKKITIFLDGNPSLAFVGEQIHGGGSDEWKYFTDSFGSEYTINKKYIVAIVIE